MIHLKTKRNRKPSTSKPLRSTLAGWAGATALGFVLFASPAFAQNDSTQAKASVASQNQPTRSTTAGDDSIRAYRVHVSEKDIKNLRRRLAATRWPDQETVTDRSQGVQLAKMKELVRYWETDYDWRKAEAKLNALPEYVTDHRRVTFSSSTCDRHNPNAMPLDHDPRWPGSIFELAQGDRSAYRSHGVRWPRRRRLRSCPAFNAWLWFLGQGRR